MAPFVRSDALGRVRRVGQRVVLGGPPSFADVPGLGDYRLDRAAEPIELAFALGLGRLDHEGSGNGEAHRRGMESVVDEPFGDVVDRHPEFLEDPRVEDALVAHEAPGPAIEDG